jgi:hypothetical protein
MGGDVLTMQDRHVVHRNLHVVPAGSMPGVGGAAPQMFTFDVRNPLPRKTTYTLELRCTDQPFDLQIIAPKGAPITGATLRRVRRASLDKRAGPAWDRDQGFDEWFGIPNSTDESFWPDNPLFDPKSDPYAKLENIMQGVIIMMLP